MLNLESHPLSAKILQNSIIYDGDNTIGKVYGLIFFTQFVLGPSWVAKGSGGEVISSRTMIPGKEMRTGETTPSYKWNMSEASGLSPSYIKEDSVTLTSL